MNLRMTIAGLVLAAHCCPASGADFEARITVLADQPGAVIDPNIYGQFVEHLGRGVYEDRKSVV